jgi:electron transport complex protein RnfG
MKQQRMLTHGLILGAFCLGFGIVLAASNSITVEDIAARAMEDRLNSLGQVIPDSIHDNNLVDDAMTMKNERDMEITVYRATREGKVTGLAYEIFGVGYSGTMRLMMGIDTEGKILGVRVLAHKETAGLGDKMEVKKSDWILRFDGLSLGNPPAEKWKVKKDGGQFDQFTGATITPRGIVDAIHKGLELFAAHKDQMMDISAPKAEMNDHGTGH